MSGDGLTVQDTQESYLVIGGAGFLGSYVVQALVDRGKKRVAVLDLEEATGDDKVPNVEYYQGDILDEKRLVEVLNQTSAKTVFHTASPVHGLDSEIYFRVNEMGTMVVISACHAAGVRKLVYTSSTGVVWTSRDLRGVNEEQTKVPRQGYDAYHHTKAIGERMILHEDGVGGLRTVALRPCGMIGPGDRQLMKRLARVYADGRHNIQIGDNTNLVDWSYVGNIADAHVLAADQLPSADSDVSKPHPVAGHVFFVTNDAPMKQFDFQRLVFKELGDDGSKKIVVIPRWLGIVMGTVSEIWCKLTGTTTEFTRFSIRYVTATQYYDISKAKNALGYKPRVSLEEGVKMMVKWWKEKGAAEHAARESDKTK